MSVVGTNANPFEFQRNDEDGDVSTLSVLSPEVINIVDLCLCCLVGLLRLDMKKRLPK